MKVFQEDFVFGFALSGDSGHPIRFSARITSFLRDDFKVHSKYKSKNRSLTFSDNILFI